MTTPSFPLSRRKSFRGKVGISWLWVSALQIPKSSSELPENPFVVVVVEELLL